MIKSIRCLVLLTASLSSVSLAHAGERAHFWSGDWSLTVGGSVANGPAFEGAKDRRFFFSPTVSLARQGEVSRFVSRNDNVSLALYENDFVRAGAVGKLIIGRDDRVSSKLTGLSDVKFGGELGGFVEVFPIDNIRARAEVRHGIRSHNGTVVDLSVDAFADISSTVRVSAGPRATYATRGYTEAYYGVNAAEAAASGLAPYSGKSGWQSVGVGGAIDWKATDKIDTSAFVEYKRLIGPAADSSLVRQRGSRNQVVIGLSTTYRFDFTLD